MRYLPKGLREYSGFFTTLFDQTEPAGSLGRGTHYSILASQLYDGHSPEEHVLALIWDEDHDIRVIHVLERMQFENLIRPVLFAGERKGSLTLYVDSRIMPVVEGRRLTKDQYEQKVNQLSQSISDPWSCSVYFYEPLDSNGLGMIVNDHDESVHAYLEGIKALWPLGVRSIKDDQSVS